MRVCVEIIAYFLDVFLQNIPKINFLYTLQFYSIKIMLSQKSLRTTGFKIFLVYNFHSVESFQSFLDFLPSKRHQSGIAKKIVIKVQVQYIYAKATIDSDKKYSFTKKSKIISQ